MAKSGTIWIPDAEEHRKVWLLEDGRIVEGPELEVSGSGRKVRIKGRQDTSVFRKDRDSIIQMAVEDIASRHGTDILTCLNRSRAISNDESSLPEASLKVDEIGGIENFSCIWRFQHHTLPLTAKIRVELRRIGRRYVVDSNLEFDEISKLSRHSPHKGYHRGVWEIDQPVRRWGDEAHFVREELDKANFADYFESVSCRNQHDAITRIRNHINRFEEWSSIQIPDLRDFNNVRWIELQLRDSNINGKLLSDITDFVDSKALVDRISEKYQELRAMLRHLGIVANDLNPDDFQSAVSIDPDALLQVEITEDGNPGQHSVYLHLHTGTLSVQCNANTADADNDAADSWNLARFEAEMRGELDSFLNFYASKEEDSSRHRVIDLVHSRQTPQTPQQ